ncbi:tetratricopeptide repeat protein [Streptomyces sp. NPDC046909]|uniref:ATP-binding protein n=1 Tax=Streptomyces sp. NPDC046909 TaxID=3155617 RepID=UPI0033FA7AFF
MQGHGLGSRNELSGTVHGAVVQTGVVYGGVHFGSEVSPVGQTPWELPPCGHVVDRVPELDALERHRARVMREKRHMLAAVSGLGGVGKTTLALRWLNTLRPHFPDGQLYADLGAQSTGGPVLPYEILGRFLRALGAPGQQVPADPAERAALYRSLTAGRRLVVLLDDAATAAQVRPLLPGGGNVTAVTSRSRLTGLAVDGCCAVHLEALAPEAAIELLADTLSDDRVTAEPEDARTLVELCAGLPLAVRVAGARLSARPRRRITTMVRALEEEHDRLEALAIDGDHNVRAALDVSYRVLPPSAARLYRLLGLHPGPEFATAAATAVSGAQDAAELLETLHDASLLSEVGEGRHRFHDLVRLHAIAMAQQDEPRAERERAIRRLADHYLASATRAEAVIDPQHRTMARDYGDGPVVTADVGHDAEAALDWLERELPNLMAVLRQSRAAGFPTVGWQLADALWPLFLRRKYYDDWHAAHDEGVAAARELGDIAAECRMLTSGGVGRLGSGDHDLALELFERAARLFEQRGDRLGRARTLNYRGLALQRLERLDEAAELFQRAAVELPACGDRRAGALARLNLADLALATGDPDGALEHGGAARDSLEETGDAYNAARADTLLGRSCLALRRVDQAGERFSAALVTLRGMAANYEIARAVGGLGEVAEQRGDARTARDHYREALDLYSSVGRSQSPDAESVRRRLHRAPSGEPED